MISNYHTHTKRCRHARGEDEEYVQAALDRGLQILGFADHSPYIFPGDYYSDFRMPMEELEDYVASVLSLREKYADQIEVKLGLELEYYPGCFEETMQVLKGQPLDYLLLGQHALGDEQGDYFTGWPTEDEAVLKRYVRQTLEGLHTGAFSCFAHPDLIKFVGAPEIYQKHMREIVREAKALGIPLEFNLLGLQTHRNYPNRLFWELVAEEGAKAIIGFDAHQPAVLRDEDLGEMITDWLGDLQINWIEKL
ncbi:MAG: histidinol-phosphatase [Oscillospiraceae bacterium]|nr:histidinol-phosphatase [Oscillospiraceae bacterium]